jgi:hypothetical protein
VALTAVIGSPDAPPLIVSLGVRTPDMAAR